MTGVRAAAVAGSFYPGDPAELRAAVDALLDDAGGGDDPRAGPPKAVVVPHAGYAYSGPVAATAYRRLAAARGRVDRVVLLGPAHFVPFRGLAASGASAFETPLGPVPVEAPPRVPRVTVLDAAHEREHSLEVQLPFLQVVLGAFRIVPLAVGDATPDEVAAVIHALWDADRTAIVVSSDLSHDHDAATARRLDAATARAIEALDAEGLRDERACGARGVAGLLLVLRRRGLRIECLDLRSSADTVGGRARVVGYGAFATK